jgi:DNA mismatch endonuclease (patch repair protein)
MDVFSREKRKQIMSRVSDKDTKPELIVRSVLHRLGYRFRLHRKDLPGKPDILLPKYKKVILVHGCFWHGHAGCSRSKRPSTNKEFWNNKLDKNIKRDFNNIEQLKNLGWDVLVIWSCEVNDTDNLKKIITRFLKDGKGENYGG